MTEAKLSELMGLLKAKYTMKGKESSFTAGVRQLWMLILCPLPDRLAYTAVTKVLTSVVYLPDPAEVLQAVIELASPLPREEDAWESVFAGLGCLHPKPLAHPLVKASLKDMGGYDVLWHAYQFKHVAFSQLREQFLVCYRNRASSWRDRVRIELLKPAGDRDLSFFPQVHLLLEKGEERAG